MTENIEILLFEENHTSQDRLFKVIEYFLITDSALYDNPFTANTEYSMQINKIKESLDFFLNKLIFYLFCILFLILTIFYILELGFLF